MRRIQIGIALALTVAVGVVFYFSFWDTRINRPRAPVEAAVIEPVRAPTFRHPLTGELIPREREFFAAGIMYDNLASVQSQPGLEEASLVYEALAEGGITRLLAIFDTSKKVTRFGPIRSLRPYFLDWASEHGGILMHVGGSDEALHAARASTSVKPIDQIGAYEDYFMRDQSLDAPHNVFSSYSSWLKVGETLDVKKHPTTTWQFIDADSVTSRSTIGQVNIAFSPHYGVDWLYDSVSHTYKRYINGEPQLYTTGGQVSAVNVVIIEVETQTIDAIGRQRMKTTGSGDAAILNNGGRQDVQWNKVSTASPLEFTRAEQVTFMPGVTWIEVVPLMAIVRYATPVE